ncbi:hypothetical protein Ddye_032173 [Dipteronia dyeriana]|uniref:Uncharacterized protein n=1 Tax=Dipteronia dyeriana TaxID=168575 RepID=A0AAD9WN97_9ROSI|nr:hypothetical protein Ddye_032173 [Dipteronia dyeriana]
MVYIRELKVKNAANSENEGPDFSDLDKKLKKAFHRYLDAKGINTGFIGFLYDYMRNKCSREHLIWLKKMNNFIEVEETPNEFTCKMEDDNGYVSVLFTKEFQGELVYVYDDRIDERFTDYPSFTLTISKHGGLALEFDCSYLDDAVSIIYVTVGTK